MQNRNYKMFLAGLILLSAAFQSARAVEKHVQKQFFMPRNVISNKAMETSMFNIYLNKKPNGRFNGMLQATAFYSESDNDTDIGIYFGFIDHENKQVNYIDVNHDEDNYLLKTDDIIHNHHNNQDDRNLVGKFKFEPEQRVFGIRLDYKQDLDQILNGLYFSVSTPIVSVRHDIDLTDIGTQTSQDLPDTDGNLNGKTVSFRDYFAGKVENGAARNSQEPLRYAKMDGSHTTGGFADVEINVGYVIFDEKRFRLSIHDTLVIPTGNRPKGEYRFEPIYGNGGHYAIGLGLDTEFTFWKSKDEQKYVKIQGYGSYKYLMTGVEKRTVPPVFENADKPNAAERIYWLAGEQGKSKVFPLANVLTQDLNVDPGNELAADVILVGKWKNFVLDFGYEYFNKEMEEVRLRHSWDNFKYAIASYEYDTDPRNDVNATKLNGIITRRENNNSVNKGFTYLYNNDNDDNNKKKHARKPGATITPNVYNDLAIKESELDLISAAHPSYHTHKLFGSIGYECKELEYPFTVALGGSYEFANDNAALQGWTAWLKSSIYF